LQNEWRAGVEEIETNLGIVMVFARDDKGGRKISPKVRRRWIYGATSGGSENRLYF
jgi:hypothetical protein